jgi:hypothetical protein
MRRKRENGPASAKRGRAVFPKKITPRYAWRRARYVTELMCVCVCVCVCVAKIEPGPEISALSVFFAQERKFFFAGTFMPPA